jgi:hypothetical protein
LKFLSKIHAKIKAEHKELKPLCDELRSRCTWENWETELAHFVSRLPQEQLSKENLEKIGIKNIAYGKAAPLALSKGKEAWRLYFKGVKEDTLRAIKLDGTLYRCRPKQDLFYVPYTPDEGQHWVRLNIQSLHKRLNLPIASIKRAAQDVTGVKLKELIEAKLPLSQETFRGLVQIRNWEWMDYFVAEHLAPEPLFFINQNPTLSIEFACFSGTNERNTVSRYLAFPHVTESLHQFVQTKINQKDLQVIQLAYQHYTTYGDTKGMQALIEQTAQLIDSETLKTSIKDTIVNGHVELLRLLLHHVPLSIFDADEQELLFTLALRRFGDPECAQLLKKYKCLQSADDINLFKRNQKWFQGDCETCYPAFRHYQYHERALNSMHKNLYGGQSVQDTFSREAKKSVEYALWAMHEAGKSPEKEWKYDFCNLLMSLGNRRKRTACLSSSYHAPKFGDPRFVPIGTFVTGFYEKYVPQAKEKFAEQAKSGIVKTSISIKEKEYTLSELKYDPESDLFEIENSYIDFWDKDDPVFERLTSLYENLVNPTVPFENEEALRNKIAEFHWHLAHLSPFHRGSAAISEAITDALWLLHGYVPQPLHPGRSLDLEALLAKDLEAFQSLYPHGRKPSA